LPRFLRRFASWCKATKILGPVGVAAVGAEAYALESKLQDYEDFGLVPEDAMLAYRANLVAHVTQGTLDPSMVGGEVIVQVAHDQWAKAFNIPDDVKDALEPGSLLEDVSDAKMWLDKQVMAAGKTAWEYAKDVVEDPSKIIRDVEIVGGKALELGEHAIETAHETSEAMVDYASDRTENPEKIAVDAKAFGSTIWHGFKGLWNNAFGPDEPSQLERSILGEGATPPIVPDKMGARDITESDAAIFQEDGRADHIHDPAHIAQGKLEAVVDQAFSTPPFVPFGQAVVQFAQDREALRVEDPTAERQVTQVANHPEAEAMLVRLNQSGVEQFPSESLQGETAADRVVNILKEAETMDKELDVERHFEGDIEYDFTLPHQYETEDSYDHGL